MKIRSRINNFTLNKQLKSFRLEYQSGGKNDHPIVIATYPTGEGVLLFRMKVDAKGNANGYFVFRYTFSGKTEKVPLGRYSDKEGGVSFSDASAMTEPYRAKLREGINPKQANKARLEMQQDDDENKRPATFEDVIRFYIYYQYRTNKVDRENVERELKRHVLDPFANSLLLIQADQVEPDAIETVIERMVNKGIGRSSNRVKTYITTAYNMVKRRSGTMKNLRRSGFPDVNFSLIKYNPGEDVATDPAFENKADKHLSENQLTEFYSSITLDPKADDKYLIDKATFYFITLDIVLGGHRKAQLKRVTWDNVDMDERVIQIIDLKGQTGQPRPYILYLTPMALKCIKELREITRGQGSIYPFADSYVAKVLRKYSAWKGEKVVYEGLRSTCTTLMKRNLDYSEKDIDKELVKRIQNHVIAGVQAAHYDKNDYWNEKKKLLKQWNVFLESLGVWA